MIAAWSGEEELTAIVDLAGSQPCRLRVLPISRQEQADEVDEDFAGYHKRTIWVDVPDSATKFVILVKTWGRTSDLGEHLFFGQSRWLAIWVVREGTPPKRFFVEIPDLRHQRFLTITVP
jgi:hypothetical protein